MDLNDSSLVLLGQKNTAFRLCFFRQNRLNFAPVPFCFWGQSLFGKRSVDDVRDVINVSSAEVPDVNIRKDGVFVKINDF